MSQNNPEQKLAGPKQRLTATVLCSLEFILLGVFLLVVRFRPTMLGEDFGALRVLLPAILFTFWLVSLTHGAILKNNTTIWISFIFLTCGLIWLLANHPALNFRYTQLYPLYIAAPAVASAGTILFSRDKNTHLKTIIFFGAVALVLFMNSMYGWDWVVIISIGVIVVGGFIITPAITSRKGSWDDGDRNQRNLSEDDLHAMGYGGKSADMLNNNTKDNKNGE